MRPGWLSDKRLPLLTPPPKRGFLGLGLPALAEVERSRPLPGDVAAPVVAAFSLEKARRAVL